MRGKKRKVAEAKAEEESIEGSSVAADVSNDINSIEDQQKSSNKNTDQKEKDSKRFKRKIGDMEEVDMPLKLAKIESSESKGDDFSAKMEEEKDIGQTVNNRSLKEQFVSKEKKSLECLGGNGHKFCEAKIVLSQLNVDIHSNIGTMQVRPDKNEGTTVEFVKNNNPAALTHEEIERENTCSSSDQKNNSSNKSLRFEDEQPVIHKMAKESGILHANSQIIEKEENTISDRKGQVSEQNKKFVTGLLHRPSDFDQSELAKPDKVQVSSKVNEVGSDSVNSVNDTERNETNGSKSMKSNGSSESAVNVVSTENEVKENPIYNLQIIPAESITTVNQTEDCSSEICHLAGDMIQAANVETDKYVENVACDTDTKDADAEKNKTENIPHESAATGIATFDADHYEADHVSDLNNPNIQDRAVEEIYLQSTDPVNTENNSHCNHHKDADGDKTGEGLDTEYHAVPETNAAYTDMTREEPVILSPKTAAAAPEMIVDVSDDLTDSQLCAMDWSSQFPQEFGVCQKLPQTSLKPEGARLTTKLTSKSKPEDGTAVVSGLIHELAQLNKSILKTKREMEYAKHKRQQNHNLNRR